MEIIKDLNCISKRVPGRCVALGTFDGVHLGHQAVLSRLEEKSENLGLKSTVFTFSSHPLDRLKGKNSPPLLNTISEKADLISRLGIDELFLVEFNEKFAQLSPKEFIEKYLLQKLQTKQIIVGFNYTFGKGRIGTVKILKELGKTYNLEVEVVPPFDLDEDVVSSTRIRRIINKGEMEQANRLLGYPYFLRGKIVHGQKMGREIGYPTANVQFDQQKVIPANGVYVVEVSWEGRLYGGIANIGYRPTFQGKSLSLEVHIFDFTGDLYNKEMQVNFLKDIRPEYLFKDINELVKQINKDAENARDYLKGYSFSDFSA